MEKIKFRGRNIRTGEWLYGDYHREGKTHYITNPKDFLREYAPIEFIVDGKTVGQFTGLFDKNGKEIYERDIVKFRVLDDTIAENIWKEYTCEVSFCNGCFCTDGTPLIRGNWKGYDMVNVEIVGNSHDPDCPCREKGGENE